MAAGNDRERTEFARPALLEPRSFRMRRKSEGATEEQREMVWNVAPIALSAAAGLIAGMFGKFVQHSGAHWWLAWSLAAAVWFLVEHRLQTWYARRLRRQRAEDARTSDSGPDAG